MKRIRLLNSSIAQSLRTSRMTRTFTLSLFHSLLVVSLSACEDEIDVKLDTGRSELAVDAWVTDQPGPQVIKLSQTSAYFDAALPPAATGATVTITDDKGRVYSFVDSKNDGNYTWTPAGNDSVFGQVGRKYALKIVYKNETYGAVSEMRPVPAVDSITFVKQRLTPVSQEEGYRAEFFANDVPNSADFYWIRTYRNGKRLNQTSNLLFSYNGGFGTNGADTDGLLFILPIRQGINPEELFDEKDEVRVEILSITPDAYLFFQQLSGQVNNGGLFATPPANVPTNIRNVNDNGSKAVGYFGVSAVGSKTVRVEKANIRTE